MPPPDSSPNAEVALDNPCLVRGAADVRSEYTSARLIDRAEELIAGRAVFAPARLLRFMAGEPVELSATERPRFDRLAGYYREYRRILERVDASGFESIEDLGHVIRYGELRGDPDRAAELVNRCFDVRAEGLVERLLNTTLGMHLVNMAAFALLTEERKVRLFRLAASACARRRLSGYRAGAFVIGSLLDPNRGPRSGNVSPSGRSGSSSTSGFNIISTSACSTSWARSGWPGPGRSSCPAGWAICPDWPPRPSTSTTSAVSPGSGRCAKQKGCPCPAPSVPVAASWNCRQCGQQVEGQFDACWNCGALRPA